ncbi:Thiosulfate sulfurtransferase, rhodanese [Desulfurella amilsii]|uniref:Thiosulfate sulfurtransferase, rhodanese n=1 Tax=Desulfurella amilsii TaxID=1562698 RepID=A0A1X4XVI5_9BACT|nr:rhodanese-like domain-containing protein [Desulfurella amilsii]OSS41547.1 Thiosulfate sulfurtransferase, rhodanese [Desulfurella amilsii]
MFRKSFMTILVTLFFGFFNLAFAKLQVITTQQAAQLLQNNKNVIVIDTRADKDYLNGHLPNAVNLTNAMLSVKRGDVVGLVSYNRQLEEKLSDFGLKENASYVVYSGENFDKPQFFLTNATRVAAILYWAGVKDIYYMDGGYQKWVDEGRPIAKGEFRLPKSNFVINRNRTTVFSFLPFVEWGLNHENLVQFVDARNYDQFTGKDTKDKRLARFGHLKDAKWVYVANFMQKEKNYWVIKPKSQIEQILKNADVDINKPIISYCNTGHLASGLWFIGQAMLDTKLVSDYDGSMAEISRVYNIPIIAK